MRPFAKLVRALLMALVVACSASTAPAARADAGGDVYADFERAEVTLPPAPPGFATVRRGRVEYLVPDHYRDDVDSLETVRRRAWATISEDLGITTEERTLVRIARNETEMRAMAPVGMPPPSYASGVAYPPLGLILLTLTTRQPGASVPDVERIFVHELSHVALHRAAGPRGVPRWFSEGMAIYHSNENGITRVQSLWVAASNDSLLPLTRLSEGFADGSGGVEVAYAQSADVVGYLLRQHHGRDKMRRLLSRLREGATFDQALEHAYFLGLVDLERVWRADLEERQSAYPFVLGGGGLWMVVVIVVAVAYIRRRRRHRKTLERWANEDAAIDSLEAELERKLAALEGRDATHAEQDGARTPAARAPNRTLH